MIFRLPRKAFSSITVASAHMAVDFLQAQQVAPELVQKVEQAILTHMTPQCY